MEKGYVLPKEGDIMWASLKEVEGFDTNNISESHLIRPFIVFMLDKKDAYCFYLSSNIRHGWDHTFRLSSEKYHLTKDSQASLNRLFKIPTSHLGEIIDILDETDQKRLERSVYTVPKGFWPEEALALYRQKYLKYPEIKRGSIIRDAKTKQRYLVYGENGQEYTTLKLDIPTNDDPDNVVYNGKTYLPDIKESTPVKRSRRLILLDDLPNDILVSILQRRKRYLEDLKSSRKKQTPILEDVHPGDILKVDDEVHTVIAKNNGTLYIADTDPYASFYRFKQINEDVPFEIVGRMDDDKFLNLLSKWMEGTSHLPTGMNKSIKKEFQKRKTY